MIDLFGIFANRKTAVYFPVAKQINREQAQKLNRK
jgi:hypothetical protein